MITSKLLENIFIVTLVCSVLIALVFILTPLINKKYTAKWRYFVWLILALRLVIPINFSLPNAPISLDATPIIQNYHVSIPQSQSIETTQQEYTSNEENQAIVYEAKTTAISFSINEVILITWLAGATIFMLYQLIGYCIFKRSVKRWSIPIKNAQINDYFNKLKQKLSVGSPVQLKCCKTISGPLMAGLLRPIILIPHENYDSETLCFILKHELVHYKRHDIWYKLLLTFANAIHWFNPLVYLMVRGANKDIEISCDEEVLNNKDVTFRINYGEAILSAMNYDRKYQTAFSTYFYGGKNTMKKRLQNIVSKTKKKSGVLSLCMIIILVSISGIFVACGKKAEQTQAEKLLSYQTPYIGDNSKVSNIINTLKIPEGLSYEGIELHTSNEPYYVTINYSTKDIETLKTNAKIYQDEFIKNAIIMLSLIDNADSVKIKLEYAEIENNTQEFSFITVSEESKDKNTVVVKQKEDFNDTHAFFIYSREKAEQVFGKDIREYAKNKEAFEGLLDKINALSINDYVVFSQLSQIIYPDDTKQGIQIDKSNNLVVSGENIK